MLKDAINKGLETEDFFGFAGSKEDGKYLGFVFGRNTMVTLDELALLIEREAAAAYKERIEPAPQPEPGTPDTETRPNGTPSPGSVTPPQPGGNAAPGSAPNAPTQRQFYGNIKLEPIKAKMDFATIVDEVVQQFTSRLGVDVSISVETQANSKEGFDEALQRTIKENCNVLRFSNAEFEAGSDSY